MTQQTYAAGDRVTSKCNKCGDFRSHTIVVMVDGTVGKVQCDTCSGVHKYRPEKAEKAAKTKSSTGTKQPRMTKKEKAAQESYEEWQKISRAMEGKTPVPYKMDGTFEVNQYLQHPTFGPGVVMALIKPNKMEVRFEVGTKLLMCTM